MSRNYRNLKIWEKSHKLVLELYKVTSEFPKDERYGLISQIRRSAASIGMNIAEGCGQKSNASMRRYLLISLGSTKELEYQIELSKDLSFLSKEKSEAILDQIIEIGKMTNSFISKLSLTPKS